MNDLYAKLLRDIVDQYGREICNDPQRLRALLLDLLGTQPGKHTQPVNVLVLAVTIRLADDLLQAASLPPDVIQTRAARRLETDTAMNERAARWVVETWGYALGLWPLVAGTALWEPKSTITLPPMPPTQPLVTGRDTDAPQSPNRPTTVIPAEPPWVLPVHPKEPAVAKAPPRRGTRWSRVGMAVVLLILTLTFLLYPEARETVLSQPWVQQALAKIDGGPGPTMVTVGKPAEQDELDRLLARRAYAEVSEQLAAKRPDSARDYVRRGRALLGLNRPQEAQADFEAALQLERNNPEVLAFLARAYAAQGDTDRALEMHNETVRLAPNNARVYEQRARTLIALGFYKEAGSDCDQAVTRAPEAAEAWEASASYFLALKRYGEAAKDCDEALRLDEKAVGALLLRAQARLGLNNLDGARADCDKAVALNRRDALAHEVRGVVLGHRGDADGALKALDRAIQLQPASATAHAHRAEVRWRRLEPGPASADCQTALQLNSRLALAHALRGLLRVEKGELSQALADGAAAQQHDPKMALALVVRAEAHAAKNELGQALADCDAALRVEDTALVHWARGWVHQRMGKHDLALEDYQKAIDLDPHCAPIYLRRCQLHREKSDLVKALADAAKAVELLPLSALAHEARATIHEDRGEHDQAIRDADTAIELDPNCLPAHLCRAKVSLAKLDYERAGKDCDEILRLQSRGPWAAWAYQIRGDTCRTRDDKLGAINNYTKALELAPSAAVHRRRGDLYMARGNYTEAANDFAAVVRLEPKDHAAHHARGRALWPIARTDEALAAYSEAIGINPNIAEYHVSRGEAHSTKGKTDLAIDDYTAALRLAPSRTLFEARGRLFLLKPDYARAADDFTEVARLDPNNDDAHYCRGRAFYHQGKYPDAIEAFSSAIRLRPNASDYYSWRAGAHKMKGNNDLAIDDYTAALRQPNAFRYRERGRLYLDKKSYALAALDFTEATRLDPGDHEAHNLRGVAYYRQDKWDDAISAYSDAIRQKAGMSLYHLNRAWAYYGKKDYGSAIPDLDETIRIDPQNASAWNLRGNCRHYRGAYFDATVDYTRAITINPNDAVYYSNRGRSRYQLSLAALAIEDFDKAIELKDWSGNTYFSRALAHENLNNINKASLDHELAVIFDRSFADKAKSHDRCYLRVFNNTNEELTVRVQYEYRSGGQWVWAGDGVVWTVAPGARVNLVHDDWKIQARRIRIWAKSATGQWIRDKNQDVWLCQNPYKATKRLTWTYTFNP